MKEKIAEIVEHLCIVCPSEITCGFDARAEATQAILALIEQEQKPMRGLLQEAKTELEYFQAGCDPSSTTDTVVAKIDAVLEGK